jgi:hypothetical protein
MHTKCYLESLKGRDLSEKLHRWEHNIKLILRKYGRRAWTGYILLRIGTSDGAFVNMVMNLQVLKKWGISRLAVRLSASDGVCVFFLSLLQHCYGKTKL